jgi:hypothetical protein
MPFGQTAIKSEALNASMYLSENFSNTPRVGGNIPALTQACCRNWSEKPLEKSSKLVITLDSTTPRRLDINILEELHNSLRRELPSIKFTVTM